MRQPLQAASLFAASLAADGSSAVPAHARDLVAGLQQALEALSAQFDAAVWLARHAEGRLQPRLEVCDMNQILARLVDRHLDGAQAKDIHLRRVAYSRWALADPVLLVEALSMLLQAILYDAREGVVVGGRRNAQRVRLHIYQRGSVVPVSRQPSMFERLSDYGHDKPDRGLSLAAAHTLIEAMGGRLRYVSGRGGAVWQVELPLA